MAESDSTGVKRVTGSDSEQTGKDEKEATHLSAAQATMALQHATTSLQNMSRQTSASASGVKVKQYPNRRTGQFSGQMMPLPPKSPSFRKEKVVVYVRVVFCKLGEIDTVKECFTADVFMQARWREEALDGTPDDKVDSIDWNKYWTPRLYIRNSVTEMKDNTWRLVVRDENNEAYVYERRRVKAVFLENMELNEFPFDTQDLTVDILSERNIDELEIEEDGLDPSSINVQSFVDEQEWKLYLYIETRQAIVNVMDGSNEEHPSISFRCRASRRFGFYVWNIIIVMFFICSMTFATFSVDFKLPQNRLQLTFILLLTTVTFKFTVNQSLPRISYLTYLDYYIMSSMIMLITICIWHAIVASVLGSNPNIVPIDKYVLAALASLYIVGNIVYMLVVYFGAIRRRQSLGKRERAYNVQNKTASYPDGITNAAIDMKTEEGEKASLTKYRVQNEKAN